MVLFCFLLNKLAVLNLAGWSPDLTALRVTRCKERQDVKLGGKG